VKRRNRSSGWGIEWTIPVAVFLAGCATGAEPLRLPPGHPADPATPGLTRGEARPAPVPGTAQPETPTIYTCPMHPEVTSPVPGKCPKCGMVLQPVKGQR